MKLTYFLSALFVGIALATPINDYNNDEDFSPARRDNAMAQDNRCEKATTKCSNTKECPGRCFCDPVSVVDEGWEETISKAV
ncbi:hypothetical protein FQN55_004735 [Onygenales sp. PD_40]|nr:hypothetical protein FQN55_004735 [Onygenales sp. PD_40]KAK2782405.1 hypothetical protein FQN52_000945 [Onygenales sp. PD_12]